MNKSDNNTTPNIPEEWYAERKTEEAWLLLKKQVECLFTNTEEERAALSERLKVAREKRTEE